MDFTHIYQFTDCISLEAHLHQAGAGTAGDKRLAIDVSYLRQVLWRRCGEENGDPLNGDHVPKDTTSHAIWVETKTMLADCLTKKMKCDQMEKLLRDGSLAFMTWTKRTARKPWPDPAEKWKQTHPWSVKKPWVWNQMVKLACTARIQHSPGFATPTVAQALADSEKVRLRHLFCTNKDPGTNARFPPQAPIFHRVCVDDLAQVWPAKRRTRKKMSNLQHQVLPVVYPLFFFSA